MTKMNWERVRQENRTRGLPPKPAAKPNTTTRPPRIDPDERLQAEAFVRAYDGSSKWMLSVQAGLCLPLRALTLKQFETVNKIRDQESRKRADSHAAAPTSSQKHKSPTTSKPVVSRGGSRSRRTPTT